MYTEYAVCVLETSWLSKPLLCTLMNVVEFPVLGERARIAPYWVAVGLPQLFYGTDEFRLRVNGTQNRKFLVKSLVGTWYCIKTRTSANNEVYVSYLPVPTIV
jgi:hypothetical protein